VRVVVASTARDCPTHLALNQEDIAHSEWVLDDSFTYGELWTELWRQGEPFVLYEHDVIPYPGATRALIDCDCLYCAHEFAIYPGNLVLSLGAGKYTPIGYAPPSWASTPWDELEQEVMPFLSTMFGPPHVHTPPLGHLRLSGRGSTVRN
jgi:hypothetical protein